MLPEIVGGRYRIERELGHGGMGVVYLAREEGRTEPVALKVLLARQFSESALRHFEQEFHTLTALSHPNLTEVYDFGRVSLPGSSGQVPFFTMEYVDGETIQRHFSSAGNDWSRLFAVLAQVGQALAYLHVKGLVHQDVKTSNILVSRTLDGEPRVKLMDLGLAGRPRESGTPGSIRGTVAYIAPEAATGGFVDLRSDLYSLGCVAYEVATGRTPFQGSSAIAILRGHLQESPLPPSAFNRSVPHEFEELILKLLAKDPGQRFATADRFLEALNKVAGGTLEITTPESRRRRVLGSGFVGRERELRRLAAAVAETRLGTGKLILLVAGAGVGKSRLLREFQVRSQLDGVDVFVGRSEGGSGSAVALLDALAKAIRARGPLQEETLRRHGPALEEALGSSSVAGVPSDAAPRQVGSGDRFRLLAAVSAVVEDLGRTGPLVLAVEDLHLADETTCTLLSHLARTLATGRAEGAPAPPLLLVGTYRGDEVSRSSPLFELLAEAREEKVIEEMFLDPFTREETASLLRAMVGADEIPPALLDRVFEATRGNPFYLGEWIALLAEEGHLEPGSGAPLDAEALCEVEVPGRIRDLLELRLRRVGAEALQVLGAAAVLGGMTVDIDAVSAVTGMRWEHVVRQLIELSQTGLVHREEDDAGNPSYRVDHPGLLGLVVEKTSGEEARILHGRALSYLERRGIPSRHGAWAALAGHAEAAGQAGRAIDAYSRAGDLAARLHAHHEAIVYYGRGVELLLRQGTAPTAALCSLYSRRGESYALSGDLQRAEEDYRWMLARAEKEANSLLKARAHLALGDLLAVRSQYADAQENLELALEIAARLGDRSLSARAGIGLGRVASKLGQFDEGLAHFERAVELAREAGEPERVVEALLAKGTLHREQGNYRLSLAAFEEASAGAGGRAGAALEAAIEEGAALALEVQGNHRDAAQAYERARTRARERGDVLAVASLTASLGSVHMRTGQHDAARREIEEALTTQRRLGSHEGMIRSLQSLAALHFDQGRYDLALETGEDALRLARRIGKKDLVAVSLNLIGGIHLRFGDLEKAGACLEEAHRLMRDIRSPRWLAVFLQDLGDLRRLAGDAGEARKDYQESAFLSRKVGDRRLEALAMNRLGEAHLQDNDYDRALVSCRKALSLVEGSGLPREEADSRLLRARIELGRPGGDVVRAEIDALDALERYRELGEPEKAWQAEHASGKAALRLGRREDAEARIERAHRYLEGSRSRLGERWQAAFLDEPRRRDLYDDWERLRATATREASGAQEGATGGEFQRLQEEAATLRRLLDINRTLNSTTDAAELLDAILQAALELTRAERGFILLREDSGITTRQARGAGGAPLEGEALEFSRSVAMRTIEGGEPLLCSDAESDERLLQYESLRELRIRSVLAVPLRVKSEVAGAIYLDTRLDRGVFTPRHLELTTRLSDQAALAIDTARLVARIETQRADLERLNQELQRTVSAQQSEIENVREELISTRSSIELRYRFEDMVGASPGMLKVYYLIERLAPKKLPVLIVGESGTGKELIARALHVKSEHASGPFFTVNCAALTETLLESELFGYKKGAFTGADRDKPGYFEMAHRGTLFLDEIGDMGPAMQSKLLRAIQEGEILPVGGKSPIKVDVRIVSATNRNLQALIHQGKFREDLYYRINVGRIDLPPLRERKEDIPLLVDHFLGLLADDEGQPKHEIEPPAMRRLMAHDWPGNVRELQHQLLRVATFAKGQALTLRDLEKFGDLPPRSAASTAAPDGSPAPVVDRLDELERKQIRLALERADGNKTKAAELLGINRATLFRKLKRFGL